MGLMFTQADFLASLPLMAISVLALIVMVLEGTIKKGENIVFGVSLAGLAITAGIVGSISGLHVVGFQGMLLGGGYAAIFNMLFVIVCASTILFSKSYLEKEGINYGEYYALLLFATAGMMMMASALDLIMVFLGIELMSVCLYVLAGFFRKRIKSNESALKYFLLGSFATGFLLYGIALIYGATETTNFSVIVQRIPQLQQPVLFWIGVSLLVIGFSFKVAAVPFHMWVPDVYEGAPTPVSGFMSTGAKAAAFSALLLFFSQAITVNLPRLIEVFAILSAASMIVGNIFALAQKNIKRMLAYSSIAHAGYILSGVTASNTLGQIGVIYYLVAYSFMNLGAFGVLSILEKDEDKNLTFDDYLGLWHRKPVLASLMALFMFSLAGIPPFAGFFGKYYVFAAAVSSGFTWLAVIGVLASLVSVYYYLHLVVVMFFNDPDKKEEIEVPITGIIALLISAIIIVVIGLFPSTILQFTRSLF
ncbi:MAG: NADH-quinone oxidoreductase subunit N [Bacteroidota bacterium]